jgi:hypothetical protein
MNCAFCGSPDVKHIFRVDTYRKPGYTFRVYCEVCSDKLRRGSLAFSLVRHLDTTEGQVWLEQMLFRIMQQGE